MSDPPYLSNPNSSPICPQCGRYLKWIKGKARLECAHHGLVDPLYIPEESEKTGGLLTESLCVEDNPFVRARKAWKVMGFSNDRLGQTGTLAEIFMAYQELDRASVLKYQSCDHEWVDDGNQESLGGKICLKCRAVKVEWYK